MDNEKNPKVSVCVTTFNHEKYVRKCLDGILSQKTSFDFEIIVHDDASKDATSEIVVEYAKSHPSLIIPILQTINCYSQNPHAPLLNCARAARGEYLAICEGDDYWIDPEKLEIQNKILESDVQIALTVSPGKLERDGRLLRRVHSFHGDSIRIFHAQDVLNIPWQFAPTASYFLRREILIQALDLFRHAPIGDLFIEIYAGLSGDIVYNPRISSVYRLQTESSWSSYMLRDRVKNMLNYIKKIELTIEEYKANSNFTELNWDKKRAAMYYGLAVAYLEERRFEGFASSIERSIEFDVFSKKQRLLYIFRRSKSASLVLGSMLPIIRRIR